MNNKSSKSFLGNRKSKSQSSMDLLNVVPDNQSEANQLTGQAINRLYDSLKEMGYISDLTIMEKGDPELLEMEEDPKPINVAEENYLILKKIAGIRDEIISGRVEPLDKAL